MALATLLSGVAAHADKNDLRLVNLGNPDAGERGATSRATTDFQAFARAMAASLMSANLMPPETLGHAGFNVNAELSVVSLPGYSRDREDDSSIKGVFIPAESSQPLWSVQPDGSPPPEEDFSQPGSAMLVPSLHVRKGLPFSTELGGRVAWIEKSRMIAATGEVKVALHEGGVIEGFFKYLPDLGVRGHITKLFGAQDLSLTAMGLDVGVGKRFPLGGMVTLTPYGGLDFSVVSAQSATLDFQPDRTYDSTVDPKTALQNTSSYGRLHFHKNMLQRIYGGARFIGGVLQLGAEISFTRLGNTPVTDDPQADTRALPTIVTFNTSLGMDF
jgi:hypothetical protein